MLPSHKKELSNTCAATWVDLETLILSELSQKEKDKYHMVSLICGTFKNDTIPVMNALNGDFALKVEKIKYREVSH